MIRRRRVPPSPQERKRWDANSRMKMVRALIEMAAELTHEHPRWSEVHARLEVLSLTAYDWAVRQEASQQGDETT